MGGDQYVLVLVELQESVVYDLVSTSAGNGVPNTLRYRRR